MLRTIEQFIDAQFLTMVFAAIAAGATVLTLAMPLLARDTLSMRMKAVAFERERIRLRERERLAQGNTAIAHANPKTLAVLTVKFVMPERVPTNPQKCIDISFTHSTTEFP